MNYHLLSIPSHSHPHNGAFPWCGPVQPALLCFDDVDNQLEQWALAAAGRPWPTSRGGSVSLGGAKRFFSISSASLTALQSALQLVYVPPRMFT